jgi:CRP-like cAMP-binding protein
MRFDRATRILEQGSRPNEVCLIVSGNVLNINTGRLFTTGTIFGEIDLILKRERRDTYIADTEVYLFKYERKIFEIIMK